jgi:hypothetical protein
VVARRLAFLAEAPAGEEVDAGRALSLPAPIPLVGPSGRLFAQMLRGAGIARTDPPPAQWGRELDAIGLRAHMWERSDHWIGNVWDVRLEGDDASVLFASATEARAGGFGEAEWYAQGYGWLRPEYRPALARLARELAGFAPDAVVTLGAAATWALTGEIGVKECQGTRMIAQRVVPGVPVYPTLHPAHVIQDFRMLQTVTNDIERAARGVMPWARKLYLEPDLQDLGWWWTEYGCRAALLSVDIENMYGQVDCISFAARPDGVTVSTAMCIPFVDWRSPNRSYWPTAMAELKAWNTVEAWLNTPTAKVFQNGLYDVSWLWGRMGLRVRNYRHDTRLMQHIVDPEMPKSLAFMGPVYTVPPGPWKLMRTGEEKRDA